MRNGLTQLDVLVGDWVGESKKYSDGRGRMTVAPFEDGKFVGKIQDGGNTIAGQWEFQKMARAGKSTSTSPKRKPPADVDAYIAAAPEAVRPQLRALRAAIWADAPKATEKMSYGIPFYEYGGKPGTLQSRLIYFAAQKNHIAVYPAGDAKGLEQYLTERSTLRFPLDRPLPIARIRALLRARVKAKDAAAKGKRTAAAARGSGSARSKS